MFFSGYSEKDACPDLGDSAITEVGGLGAFAISASPAMLSLVDRNLSEGVEITKEMYEITLSEHQMFKIPYLGFRGTPIGIDVLKVVETGITPICDTTIAHKDSGHGMIGAGMLRIPMSCFENALVFLHEEHGA